jgi:hypothetical protein
VLWACGCLPPFLFTTTMTPLTRQRTLQSIHSWWSDSNPTGPNINLNAAAKPLMKLMYHRQALGFIRKNRDIALSEDILEIYSSYLTYELPSLIVRL